MSIPNLSTILAKVRQLEIISRRLSQHLFSGEYHSAFRGRGMTFREVRPYADGDDPRFIDWNVSARYSQPFTKLFEEERELHVMLLIDLSASTLPGSGQKSKQDLAAELAAVLAFAAISNQDKVGAILFSDQIEKYIPLKKGRDHGMLLVRNILTAGNTRKKTDLTKALKYLNNTTRQKNIVFVISDFLDPNLKEAIQVTARKHELIGIRVYDALDQNLPSLGLLPLIDSETGTDCWIDSEHPHVKQAWEAAFFQHSAYCKEVFQQAGADLLHLRTDQDYVKVLQHFFIHRK
jgi:uncharacterized protein (DUF58 family)